MEGEEKGPDRFNSGKWLTNSQEIVDLRTSREQIIILPPFSVHAREQGNCEIKFRIDGEQKSVSAGTRNKRAAEAQAEAILARWLAAHGKTTAAAKTGVQAEIAGFLDAQYTDQKPATRTEAVLVLRRFAEAFPVTHIQEITPQVFRDGAKKYRGEAAPKYWANILSITGRFARFLVDQGKIAQDFTKGVARPSRHSFGRRDAVWEEDELEAVLAVLNTFDQEVLLVMRWTGMDSSDVFELRRKHLIKDEKGNWIIRKRREKSKTEEETIVQPIGSKVLPILMGRYKRTKAPEDRLFGGIYSSARSFTTSLLGRVRRAAGPTKDLKSLRHTFATYHAERGVPLDVLRPWMGHALDSRVLDRIYVHRKSTARFMD